MSWMAGMIALLILAAAVVLTAYYSYRVSFYNDPHNPGKVDLPMGDGYDVYLPQMDELKEKIKGEPYEELTCKSLDGLTLAARYYHHRDGAPIDILVHGYKSQGENDFCGIYWLCKEHGHNVLIIDQRACGNSEGNTISFGINEQYDVLCWVDDMVERFGPQTKILLMGISMGAATVLMASDKVPEKNVVGIVADCGYTSPREIINKVMADWHYPKFLYPMAWLGARLFGHFDLHGDSALIALKNSQVPVLFIHGKADTFVPCQMSRQNYEVCASHAQLLLVPDAPHGISYLVDTPAYTKAVNEFMDSLGV